MLIAAQNAIAIMVCFIDVLLIQMDLDEGEKTWGNGAWCTKSKGLAR
jgi:hypothetical protein